MTDAADSEYQWCRTCGEYFLKNQAVNGTYCSNFCARRYTRCTTCGRYFFREDVSAPPFCSEECALKYKENYRHVKLPEDMGEFI